MHPLVTLLLAVAGTLGLIALVVLVRRASRRRAAERAHEHEQQLARSQERIERLEGRLEALSKDVEQVTTGTRPDSGARGPRSGDYLITSLPEHDDDRPVRGERRDEVAVTEVEVRSGTTLAAAVAATLETQVVAALARHQGVSSLRDRAVDLGVQGVALAHGVRRALSAETLDRAAAEAHVARRRSRRVRRAEVREARRLVRHLRAGDGAPVTVRAERPTRDRDVA
ncbi:hypothetical protein G7072_09985 [Nocardioides sp. HDW12B]|uniref:hypothetical protein n=1 Tax=Nocardioides sp. HDW12B TaxID=2714939 RepID=UPI001409E315|nr:hypothetical protein [Nocardioides sp. HDW12B]QIK66628.1 hypothetical protein G7072_09985 [Nocardioides sp. HDW12B]